MAETMKAGTAEEIVDRLLRGSAQDSWDLRCAYRDVIVEAFAVLRRELDHAEALLENGLSDYARRVLAFARADRAEAERLRAENRGLDALVEEAKGLLREWTDRYRTTCTCSLCGDPSVSCYACRTRYYLSRVGVGREGDWLELAAYLSIREGVKRG